MALSQCHGNDKNRRSVPFRVKERRGVVFYFDSYYRNFGSLGIASVVKKKKKKDPMTLSDCKILPGRRRTNVFEMPKENRSKMLHEYFCVRTRVLTNFQRRNLYTYERHFGTTGNRKKKITVPRVLL